MNWKREQPGVYSAGPYLVERQPYHRAIWTVNGPGVSAGVAHEHKADAQAEAADAALERISGQEATVEPVVGDLAYVPNWRGKDKRGRVSTIINKVTPNQKPIYCVKFNVGGGRKCLFREEFEVMLP